MAENSRFTEVSVRFFEKYFVQLVGYIKTIRQLALVAYEL